MASVRPLVSVVLPVRDAVDHLAAAVDSIRAQTVTDWELIIVDNGSSDGSDALAADLVDRDPRIRLLLDVAGDRASAKNAGVSAARGKYIARMDADDVSVRERFEVQLAYLKRTKIDVCGGWALGFGDRTGFLMFHESHGAIERDLIFRSPLLDPTLMASASVMQRHPYSEAAIWKDLDLAYRLVANHRLGNVPAVLLRYRLHPAQSSVADREGFRRDAIATGARQFRRLFGDASHEDWALIERHMRGQPFSNGDELVRFGRWLVRLADDQEPSLRRALRARWLSACACARIEEIDLEPLRAQIDFRLGRDPVLDGDPLASPVAR